MKEEMTGLIVTGGTINLRFSREYLKTRTFDQIIAVDGGLLAIHELQLAPTAIVGDFDTVDSGLLEEYKKSGEAIYWEFHNPEKDETDTELALNTAMKLGCTSLVILGATGGRMDHSIGNIHLLYSCLKKGISAAIIDEKNKITVLAEGRSFQASEIWGKYISFLPLSTEVKGITLTGFKYPLTKKDISIGTSLCISNELLKEQGTIVFDSGLLLCIESHD